jgi:dimethylhistidine N-methyltransferase
MKVAPNSSNPARPAQLTVYLDQTEAGPDRRPQELADSLSQPQARIAPKYFYDSLGSALFTSICELPEYYPTRTERGIFEAHAPAMAEAIGANCTLVDLGAGDCAKARELLPVIAPAQYVAVDVSVAFLHQAVSALQRMFPTLPMVAVGADFADGLRLPSEVHARRRTFFYPGSSIGNFEPAQAVSFLRSLRTQCGDDGGLLIGVDLVKPKPMLDAAYDDALGVTAAFNLNVLLHVNRVLGSDFALADWRHVAFFDEAASRIEMHLEARRAVSVGWPGGERRFAAGERIHTENSYKYTIEGFEALLRRASYSATHWWTDASQAFAVFAAS